jgi:hypothetical protein
VTKTSPRSPKTVKKWPSYDKISVKCQLWQPLTLAPPLISCTNPWPLHQHLVYQPLTLAPTFNPCTNTQPLCLSPTLNPCVPCRKVLSPHSSSLNHSAVTCCNPHNNILCSSNGLWPFSPSMCCDISLYGTIGVTASVKGWCKG